MFGMVQLTRIHPLMFVGCPRHLRHDPPPSYTLSGNHPEPVFHPRMNSRSEHIASYYVRSSLAFHLSCHALFAMISVYLLFLPPLNIRLTPLLPPTTPLPCMTTSSTTVPLPSSFQANSAPSPLPHISYLSLLVYLQ